MSFKIKKPLLKLFQSNSKSIRKYEMQFIEAIIQDDMETLRKVTKDKIKPLAPILWNDQYVFPIHIGCALGSLDVVKFLFRIGCSLETKTECGRSPLHFAAIYNATHPEVTGHLLDMGAKTNVKDKNQGYTPFHCACESNNFGAAKRLLEVTKRFVIDNNGKTAKDIAIQNDCDQIVSLFEDFDKEIKRKEALMSLPGRIEQLEKQTEFLLRHSSVQSGINDSGLDNSHDVFDHHHTSAQNLISLHLDDLDMTRRRSKRLSGSSHSVHNIGLTAMPFRRGSVPALLSLNESSTFQPHQRMASVGTEFPEAAPVPVHFSHISPIQKNIPEDLSPEPVTRESPLNKVYRHQVQRNYSFLHSMMKPEKVIIKLFSKDHIDLETKEKLSKMTTQQEKNDYILHNHVLKGSMGMYEDFLKSLRESNQGHIAERLNRLSESPLYSSSRLELSVHRESTV